MGFPCYQSKIGDRYHSDEGENKYRGMTKFTLERIFDIFTGEAISALSFSTDGTVSC